MSSFAQRPGLLWLTPFVPHPPHHGGAIRIFSLLRQLGPSIPISLICLADASPSEESLADLRQYCRDVRVVPSPRSSRGWKPHLVPPAVALNNSARLKQEIHQILDTQALTTMQIEYTSMAAHVALSRCMPAILTVHQISSLAALRRLRFERTLRGKMRAAAAAATFYAFERRVLPRFDRVIAVSDVDRSILTRWLPEQRVRVVPNGVDCTRYNPAHSSTDRISDSHRTVLFMGNFRHPPNVDAVLYLVREVWPKICSSLPDTRLTILGAQPPADVRDMQSDTISVTGRVEDTRPYLAQSRALVVPVRYGSGTRIKILEAFAAGVPVVSTTLGMEGIDASPDSDFLLADDPRELAAQLLRILRDDALHLELSTSARALAVEQHDWAMLSHRQAAIYQELCS